MGEESMVLRWPSSPDVLAGVREFALGFGRINQGDEFPGAHFQNRVGRDEGAREGFFTTRRDRSCKTGDVCYARREFEHPVMQAPGRDFDHSRNAGFFAPDDSDDHALFITNHFLFKFERQAEWPLHRLRA
jgi:hypothetical protein